MSVAHRQQKNTGEDGKLIEAKGLEGLRLKLRAHGSSLLAAHNTPHAVILQLALRGLTLNTRQMSSLSC